MRATILGRCPLCGEAIPRRNKLIEYESAEGWTTMLAECEHCTDAVHPR